MTDTVAARAASRADMFGISSLLGWHGEIRIGRRMMKRVRWGRASVVMHKKGSRL